jgi:hypothetical protein
MTKQPLLNALVAYGYVALVVMIMQLVASKIDQTNSILGPIAFLSLFTLSAAVMGYLFFMEPMSLYMNNKKPEALKLFLQTVGSFAVLTIITFMILFLKA